MKILQRDAIRSATIIAGLSVILVLATAAAVMATAAADVLDTSMVPEEEPGAVHYLQEAAESIRRHPRGVKIRARNAGDHAPIIRVYKDSNAWFDENRDHATLISIGKVLGQDYFVHPVSDCASGIPADTAVVLFPSNGHGFRATRIHQNSANCQKALESFLERGGVVIVDMGDNDDDGGFQVPGFLGSANDVLGEYSVCQDMSLAPDALGPDLELGTEDDHPLVKGPDGIAGTEDDLNNSNIDMAEYCYGSHGYFEPSMLPDEATPLITRAFYPGGPQEPIMAEYCYGDVGKVIVDTITKEFIGHPPPGLGSTRFLVNLLSYALSDAPCISPIIVDVDIKPGSDENPINCTPDNSIIPVAILSTDEFDALSVDHTTVSFEGATEIHVNKKSGEPRIHKEDVNKDRDKDLVFHFRLEDVGLTCHSTQGRLVGSTKDGTPIRGADNVRMIAPYYYTVLLNSVKHSQVILTFGLLGIGLVAGLALVLGPSRRPRRDR